MTSPTASSPRRHRVISLLPSTTEILFAIGAGDCIVGVTHECDHPADCEALPRCTSSLLAAGLSAAEIDAAVTASLKSDAHTVYRLHEGVVRGLEPTVIVTQSLCAVCAVPQSQVEGVACTLPRGCKVIASDPHSLDDLLANIKAIGAAVGHEKGARRLVTALEQRLSNVRRALSKVDVRSRPRVVVLEWSDPPFAPGHWVPEQVECAGGTCVLGEKGVPSKRVTWDELKSLSYGADIVIAAFCGYNLAENQREIDVLIDRQHKEWVEFVRGKRVYATNASAYFSRPGNRLVDGVEVLCHVVHGLRDYRPRAEGMVSRLVDARSKRWVDLCVSCDL